MDPAKGTKKCSIIDDQCCFDCCHAWSNVGPIHGTHLLQISKGTFLRFAKLARLQVLEVGLIKVWYQAVRQNVVFLSQVFLWIYRDLTPFQRFEEVGSPMFPMCEVTRNPGFWVGWGDVYNLSKYIEFVYKYIHIHSASESSAQNRWLERNWKTGSSTKISSESLQDNGLFNIWKHIYPLAITFGFVIPLTSFNWFRPLDIHTL